MRLYVNDNEIETLKRALRHLISDQPFQCDEHIKANQLYERVELCEKLQKNCRRSRGVTGDVNSQYPYEEGDEE